MDFDELFIHFGLIAQCLLILYKPINQFPRKAQEPNTSPQLPHNIPQSPRHNLTGIVRQAGELGLVDEDLIQGLKQFYIVEVCHEATGFAVPELADVPAAPPWHEGLF